MSFCVCIRINMCPRTVINQKIFIIYTFIIFIKAVNLAYPWQNTFV